MVRARSLPTFREKLEKRDAACGPQDLPGDTHRTPCNKVRHAPYFVKIAKGLHLGYYRGAVGGSWIARRYRKGTYETHVLGIADDTLVADGIKVLDFWQAQAAAKRWAERQRLVEAGAVRTADYTIADAIADYLEEIRTEKRPEAVQGAQYTFNAFVLPELGKLACEDFDSRPAAQMAQRAGRTSKASALKT